MGLRLFDLYDKQLEEFPMARNLNFRNNKDVRESYSTKDVVDWSKRCALGLLDLGLKTGDKIALMTDVNRPEWVILDLAAQRIGLISVPLYATSSPEEYKHIAVESEIKLCFSSTSALCDLTDPIFTALPTYIRTYCFDKATGYPFWEEIMSDTIDEAILQPLNDSVHSKSICTYIYTSGTTGLPKGVMLSHDNIIYNVKSVRDLVPIEAGDRVLSFLPLCHIFERVAFYFFAEKFVEVHFTSTDSLGGEEGSLKTVKPHFFTTVPRLLEKVFEKIEAKGRDSGRIKNAILQWSIRITTDFEYDHPPGFRRSIQLFLADKIVYSKWREALGGNIKAIVVGAAACPMRLLRAFCAAGIPIREAYGMTETSPGITVNGFTPGTAQIGTVGIVLKHTEIMLDNSEDLFQEGEGEICVSGPGVMKEYYKQPEKTEEVFYIQEEKKWLRTGDIGRFVLNEKGTKFLKITDRKKELIKTSGGKYVAPAPIESYLRESLLVDQAMIVGDNKKFVSALIVPSIEGLTKWAEEKGMTHDTLESFVKDDVVIRKFNEIIDHINLRLNNVSKVKKFILLNRPWEMEKADGSKPELTPTLKLKRRVILEKYAGEIDKLYA